MQELKLKVTEVDLEQAADQKFEPDIELPTGSIPAIQSFGEDLNNSGLSSISTDRAQKKNEAKIKN